MPTCAFLTSDHRAEYITYDDDALGPLAARGWQVAYVPWRAATDWDAFDVVVVRSPWDYFDAPDAFLAVLEAIDASAARLENPLAVMRWNLRKTYLRDLEAAGVPVVPTRWAEGGLTADALADAVDAWGGGEVVAKPVVSGGADGTFRLGRDGWAEALAALAGRPSLIQPFVPAVVAEGEWSVFAFGGAVSHAILKTPTAGDFRVQEEFGSTIRGVAPGADLLALAAAALAAVPHPEPLLYARVDAVRMPGGGWAIMELELIEPSLYFPFAPGSADRFAAAVDALGAGRGTGDRRAVGR